ncbi:hypothetical protein [Sulfurimonas sp.]|uniref:hypothetical protein n=1 Tax=Sulfurimonas sp. TaxID=2022749 RepID=UPI00261A73C4|nr:hypothetical protein [Sulfurimonas sp.]
MKRLLLSMAAVPLMVGGLSVSASANDGINILNNVKVKGEIRPRYEYADVKDNGVDAGNAFTARTHLVVTGGLLGVDGLTATVGLQGVNNFGYTNYNSTQNGETTYDKIVDPQAAMLSEASLDYTLGKTALHAGRSHVNLDNQRFIGTVGWRQMERSYDTVYAANSSIKNLSLLAAYVYGFAGVKGTTTADTNSVLLHANYKVMKELSVTGYGYLLSSIHDTYGLALTGKVDAGAKLSYRAEYAIQKDATLETGSAGKPKADAYYYNLDLGANISGILAGVNYEVLSGTNGTDGNTAFSTPLATGHKFNGWADKFLATPTGGLQDANIRLGYKAKGFGKVLAVYHNFTADKDMATPTGTATDDLGSEFDAVYVNAIPGFKNLKGLVKYAYYMSGDVTGYTKDVTKGWVQLDYKF